MTEVKGVGRRRRRKLLDDLRNRRRHCNWGTSYNYITSGIERIVENSCLAECKHALCPLLQARGTRLIAFPALVSGGFSVIEQTLVVVKPLRSVESIKPNPWRDQPHAHRADVTNSMAYGIRRFNVAFTTALQ